MRWLAFAASLLLAPSSLAAAAPADVEEAKKYFQIGTMNYDVGQYAEALSAFERARTLTPLPGFLFNIGQCHRRMGQHAEAVRFFEQYLAEAPQAKNRAEVEALLAEERALALAAPAPAGGDAAPPADDDAARGARVGGATPAANDATREAAEDAAGEGAGEGADGAILWAAIGGGVLVLAAGTAVALAMIPGPSAASLGRVDLRGAP